MGLYAAGGDCPYGFAFGPNTPTVSKPIAYFRSPIAWVWRTPDYGAGLLGNQGVIVDSDTATAGAPVAQTDFDIQSPPGTSVGTMRFAASSLSATFIISADVSLPLGQDLVIVAPGNLNGMTGAIAGSLVGSR